ncbi:MAG TPA: hypothetical protein VGE47_05705 [Burkholderiaceae bacterium]
MNMLTIADARAKFEAAVNSTDDVVVGDGVDRSVYLAELADDIRAHMCKPFLVEAEVMAPAFPFAKVGEHLSGYCIAFATGYWLVYQPDADRFFCFWGESPETLGAHGVFGSPLGCWSA